MPPSRDNLCKWVDQQTALKTFATYEETTTSQRHIKPLHWYVACLPGIGAPGVQVADEIRQGVLAAMPGLVFAGSPRQTGTVACKLPQRDAADVAR